MQSFSLIPQFRRILKAHRLLAFLATSVLTALLVVLSLAAEAQQSAPEMPMLTSSEDVFEMEQKFAGEFATYFGQDLAEVTQGTEAIATTLGRIGAETGTRPAVLWVMPRPTHLHLVLTIANGETIIRDLFDVPQPKIVEVAKQFQQDLKIIRDDRYLETAQQLHEWLIEPFEAEFLEPEGIDTLLLCLGDGVRGLPISALHDGERFLVEKYSLTRIPAFNLIKTEYAAIAPGQILAMGASEFEEHSPLPAVPVELSRILWELRIATPDSEAWQGRSFLNQDFVLPTLNNLLSTQSFDIVHLATHAEFRPGVPKDSYIQFWDTRLTLDKMREVGWSTPPLELLVLSACNTALGDSKAELGFAGLALQAGVKSALASLWYVSDAGTLALMSEFYRQLPLSSTKAEALRQAQLRMLKGEVHFEGDALVISRGPIELPDTLSGNDGLDLTHPFYWSSFSMISSPW
ncbi:MAG: CHAT domain-containing protein [Leptolyngbyaceae bacterium]|nr:CHAT domain-containing protein [Leptolyngbyaceae bacterium]